MTLEDMIQPGVWSSLAEAGDTDVPTVKALLRGEDVAGVTQAQRDAIDAEAAHWLAPLEDDGDTGTEAPS